MRVFRRFSRVPLFEGIHSQKNMCFAIELHPAPRMAGIRRVVGDPTEDESTKESYGSPNGGFVERPLRAVEPDFGGCFLPERKVIVKVPRQELVDSMLGRECSINVPQTCSQKVN